MGRPRQRQAKGISSSNPPVSSPSSAQISFPEAGSFPMEAPEDFTDLLTSVSLLTPGLSISEPSGPPWFEIMQLGEPGRLEHDQMKSPSYPSQRVSQSTNAQLDNTKSASGQQQTACSCMELVHQQLAAMHNGTDKLHSIKVMRQSTDVAEQVLCCTVCFNINRRPSDVSGNVLLLGSLLLTIATSYGDTFGHQQQRATEALRDANPVQLFLGQAANESCLVELSLGGLEYWRLLKSSFGSELDRLSSVCHSFTTRQHCIHEKGHEECREGLPCKQVGGSDRVSHPANACPRSIGSKASFTCFRTADQIRAEIDRMQRILTLDP